MSAPGDRSLALRYRPVTPERWNDLVRLFGPRGACGGCWCMWWRIPRSVYDRGRGSGNRRRLRRLVQAGPAPGLLAYHGTLPVGWIAFGPRTDYPLLGNSRVLKPVDQQPVWSVVCLFVDRHYRRRGVTIGLIEAAARQARRRGARLLEAYPTDTAGGPMPAAFVWTGVASGFRKAGFREVARRSPTRPIMRKRLRPRRTAG